MKNRIIILIMLGILLVPFVNSAIELNREEYQLGETVVAKLNFNYAPDKLNDEHIKIYDPYGKSVLIPSYIVKFSDSLYYTYFTLPTARMEDNFSLEVGPYYYTLNGELQRKIDRADIKIFTDRDFPILAVDPAAAVIDYNQQNYFYINLKNNGNTKIDLKLKLSEGVLNHNEYEISSGDTLKIKGTVNLTGEKLLEIDYNGLELNIPVIVTGEVSTVPVPTTVTVKEPSDALRFVDPTNRINVSVMNGQMLIGSINFKNFWTGDVKNVKLSLTGDIGEVLSLDRTSIDTVKPNEVVSINVEINKNKNLQKDYNGEIRLTSGDIILSYPIYIRYLAGEKKEEVKSLEEVQETQESSVKTEKEELEKQKELKTGFLFSLLTLLFVIIVVLLIVFRARKRKSKDFIFSSHHH